jgi:hypothetical protein
MSDPVLKSKYAQIAKNASSRKEILKKMPQHRAARCSRTVANTSRSRVSRSQWRLPFALSLTFAF